MTYNVSGGALNSTLLLFFFLATLGSVTITTEVGTDGATTSSRMNLSGYAGHVTIFS